MSKANITLKLNSVSKILRDHRINPGGEADYHLAQEVARMSDPYVPFRDGDLKNQKVVRPGSVTYLMPYAEKQYYENKGGNNGPKRGKQWDQRMMADRGREVVGAVAKKLGY
jgi:hypothetical protein